MTSTFDFFEHDALPAPDLPVDEARSLVAHRWGIEGTVTALGSQQDANFRVGGPAGAYVLKIANPAFTEADAAAQESVAAHLADCEPGLLVPSSRPGLDGRALQMVTVGGRPAVARLMSFLDGGVLSESRYLAPAVVSSLGDLAGRVSRALSTFDGEVPVRALQWDLRHAAGVVIKLAGHVAVPGGADLVRAAASRAGRVLDPYRESLPVQAIHGDLTDDNVIAAADRAGRRHPAGVIDFGDLTRSWAIAELAVTLSCLLSYDAPDLSVVVPAVRAYDRIRPISDDELAALWPLVVLRAASLVVSGQHQAHIDRENAYATGNLDREWRIFERAVSAPIEVMTALIRGALRPGESPAPIAGDRIVGGGAPLDLSTTSPALHGGAFLSYTPPDGFVPYLQPRLTRTVLNAATTPATVGLGVEVVARESLHAPWAGVAERHDDAVAIRATDRPTLWLSGADLADGAPVSPGQSIGRGPARIQLCSLAERPPFFVTAAMARAWAAVCPDPTPLIGSAGGVPPSDGALLDRRDAAFATVQEHYFEAPPQIERGWRHHLFDMDGRSYLDMLNNVAILGHGHPRLAEAIEQQWRLLNTNSRFHYRAVVEFAERLAALCPDPLDTVFLVNSGTEAVDLALRLAWANTGRQDVVAVREAYHGWSYATDAISTSVADNPGALGSRPPWVHTVAAPNSFRGEHRGDRAFRYAEDAVAYVERMVADGRPPAAFLAEPFYGNAGGVPLPDGYLARVYAATRAAGGLCVADEVQAGYGRLGAHFWGFEQQGVVPDIVTVAKAMGNGHPLGAVITTRAIADGFRGQGYFFSSAGGSPVSSVVGLTVLDALRDEGLQENAREVGEHLRQRLLALAGRHEIIGAVHGMGLYLGVELVRDRGTLEPAPEETAAICERLRELGVIMQPTSDRMCVLKIKPPLGIGRAEADFFADTLGRVLSEGW
ncbi:aminotransferase [Actinoplanes sp. NPDC051470]|uniref:aminotransferase n=1 Tax=Actinoplanes sp. NPDC051470 TaxID=3157224 RepID=UPI00342F965A